MASNLPGRNESRQPKRPGQSRAPIPLLRRCPTPSHAFTLLELLVTITVIAVLAGIAYPAYQKAAAQGRSAACLSNLRQLGAALNLYLADHEMILPKLAMMRTLKTDNVPVIDNTLTPYLSDPRVFSCPADQQGFYTKSGTSYLWNSAISGTSVQTLSFLLITDPTRVPLMADKEGFHAYTGNKVNLLYGDSHVSKDITFFTGP